MLAIKNWTHNFSQSFKDPRELYQYLGWELPIELLEVSRKYPIFIPRRLADKIKLEGPEGILAKQFLPNLWELDEDLNRHGMNDPIGDEAFSKAPQLIHRYDSRALFTPTSVCPIHCRYCFRKNELNGPNEIFSPEFEETVAYLNAHPEISEIIFTGGDPFTLSNEKIRKYLEAFALIPSIKDIRFHTRYVVILPERFDAETLAMLDEQSRKFRTLSLAIHSNHVQEWDEEAKFAVHNLSKLSLQLLSQTVLLKGINDNFSDLLELYDHFTNLKIRPYYLHHPDRVKGGMHFYLPLNEGRKLYAQLRAKLPGWALPHYVIDLPGGHGKISAFNPESYFYSGTFLTLKGQSIPLREPDLFT